MIYKINVQKSFPEHNTSHNYCTRTGLNITELFVYIISNAVNSDNPWLTLQPWEVEAGGQQWFDMGE
jgi:hypothetical protein